MNLQHLTIGPPDPLTFNENCSVSKRALGLAYCPLKILFEALLISDNPHTPTTSSHRGLDNDRETVLFDEIRRLVVRLHGTRGPWDNGNIDFHRDRTGFGLITEGIDCIRSGTDKYEACILYSLGELVIFRQETVTVASA